MNKKIFSLLAIAFLASPLAASAGYKCQEKGTDVTLDVSFGRLGASAILKSNEVSDFYKRFGLNIDFLETVKDIETGKYLSEETSNNVHFLMFTSSSGTAWGLDFNTENGLDNAQVRLVDQGGQGFIYTMSCESTPDVE